MIRGSRFVLGVYVGVGSACLVVGWIGGLVNWDGVGRGRLCGLILMVLCGGFGGEEGWWRRGGVGNGAGGLEVFMMGGGGGVADFVGIWTWSEGRDGW